MCENAALRLAVAHRLDGATSSFVRVVRMVAAVVAAGVVSLVADF